MPSSNDLSRHTEELKTHAKEAVHKVSEQITEQANYIRDATAVARYNTRDFIETNPWQSVAIAAGIGFLIGVAISRPLIPPLIPTTWERGTSEDQVGS